MNLTVSKNLVPVQAAATAAIDLAAEQARLAFITAGSGQAMVYLQKAIEANKFIAEYPNSNTAPNTPDPTNWPFISAEMGVTAPTMWQTAEVISQLANIWTTTGSTIEGMRMTAKAAVASATNEAAINAILPAIKWPTPPA